jgi:hypothetical protein
MDGAEMSGANLFGINELGVSFDARFWGADMHPFWCILGVFRVRDGPVLGKKLSLAFSFAKIGS